MAQLAPFRPVFSTPVWRSVLVLVAGTLLASGRRTVCAALRVTGLAQTPHFVTLHRVLNRACWCPRALARLLLPRIVAAFVPRGPVVIGLDDTIERRRGPQIAARGVYRDPVRSSRRYVVKVSVVKVGGVGGLRWLCLMVLVPIPWARRHATALGAAVPDRAGPVRALSRRAAAPPQAARRLGAPSPAADPALRPGAGCRADSSLPSPTAPSPPST